MQVPVSIKTRLFLTLGGIILLSTAFMAFYSYQYQSRQLLHRFHDLAENHQKLFETLVSSNAEGLSRTLHSLRLLEELLIPFRDRDRAGMLRASLPFFRDLQSEHNVTHMYFVDPEGKVLLRVHKPEEFGDLLERATFRRAVTTRTLSSGIEMGKNFFSLRCVTPVIYQNELIGYLEIGEEIDHIFEQMKAVTGNDVAVLLPESYIGRYDLTIPMVPTTTFGILYPTNRTLAVETTTALAGTFSKNLANIHLEEITLEDRYYVCGTAPLHDAFDSLAGLILAQHDSTLEKRAIWQGLTTNLLVFLLIILAGNIALYLSLRPSIDLFHRLHHHIRALTGNWNLKTPIEVDAKDEIGQLACDFNRMQTELALVKDRLEQRAQELSLANQELESFSYSLSHDLRLPLTRIYSAVQMLEELYADQVDETGRFLIKSINDGSIAMEELIEAILTLTRINRKDLTIENVDISAIAQEISTDLSLSDSSRKVDWIIPGSLTVNGDRSLLKVALRNLMENAWKYSRLVPEAVIELAAARGISGTTVSIRDNGVGFDMKDAEAIFTPFKRLHDASQFAGTGIGLATVQRIIQRHGGSIQARGVKNAGATISFTLPSP